MAAGPLLGLETRSPARVPRPSPALHAPWGLRVYLGGFPRMRAALPPAVLAFRAYLQGTGFWPPYLTVSICYTKYRTNAIMTNNLEQERVKSVPELLSQTL